MELFDVIRQMDLLENEQSQYYIGSMKLAIEYLHSLKIIGVIFLCHRQFQTLKTQMFLKFVPELLTLVE